VRERVHEIVEAAAGERADEVEIDVDPELATNVDPNALDRIVSNLVTNALRYGSRPIRVRAQQQDRHFRLAVEDHGDGVAAGFVPRLFERFSRAEGVPPKIGSGLGLSIAQSYAQAHGGQLFYEDASPKGARFQLVLPAPHD
jgi:signal transduction histidine kinase